MTRRLSWLLGVAGVLALALVVDQMLPPAVAPVAPAPAPDPRPALNPRAGQGVGAWLLARPLFSPSRRAAPAGSEDAVGAAPFAPPPLPLAQAPALAAASDAPQLVGVVHSPGAARVLLRAGDGGAVIPLTLGQTALGLRLTGVGRDRATFDRATAGGVAAGGVVGGAGQVVLLLPTAQELSAQAAP